MITTTFHQTYNYWYPINFIFLLILSSFSYSQAVTNGSVTGAPAANSAISAGNAPGWTTASGSPDLCNVGFPNYTTTPGLTPCPSPDGGTWLGLAAISAGERAQTTITGLTVGSTYTLAFYGSCFGTGSGIFNGTPALPQVCVGATCQSYSIPRVACVWNNYTLTFTATAATMTLSGSNTSTTNSTYANLDGFRFITPLGIEMSSFTAHLNGALQTELKWTTSSEVNNDYFTVMKSVDGIAWSELDRVDGAGNSTVSLHYNVIDPRPSQGINYYRIKQTDFDGQESMSAIESVHYDHTSIRVYPNPANTQFEIHDNQEELEHIQLYNLIGEDVSADVQFEMVSKELVRVSVEKLRTGVYILKTRSKLVKVLIE